MKEIYNGLNKYLNEICKYLERNDIFFLYNLNRIGEINDNFLRRLQGYSFNNETKENNLTFMDVYLLAREIISQIDEHYLIIFDKIISNGELDFSYDNRYRGSHLYIRYIKSIASIHLININRKFNYNDVITLVHEFIHYTNCKKNTKIRNFLTEFFSICFEEFAIDYLLDKGIDKEEISYYHRFKDATACCESLYMYEVVLLAYYKFGNINENTYKFINQFFLEISEEYFNKECTLLYNKLKKIEELNKEKLMDSPDKLGEILTNVFINVDYRYVIGTFLTLYARKYCKFEDIVYLNNHLTDFQNKSLREALSKIGINLYDKDLESKVYESLEEIVNKRKCENKISK